MFVIIANQLHSGLVVFRSGEGDWTPDICTAAIFPAGSETDQALSASKADEHHQLIIDAQIIEVQLHNRRPRPVKLRERIRAAGPTTPYAVPAVQFPHSRRYGAEQAAA